MKSSAALIFCFLLSTGFTFSATLRYVAQNGQTPDTNSPPTYTSWATAASNIQETVTVASAKDTILLGSGHYYAPTGATEVVLVNKPLTLRSSNNVPESVMIDGENARRGIAIKINLVDPDPVVFSGITISNCQAVGVGDDAYGGGIYVQRYKDVLQPVVLDSCVVTENRASRGGGLYYWPSSNAGLSLFISNSTFRANTSVTDSGGGLYVYNGAAVTSVLYGSSFENNLAGAGNPRGGGGYFFSGKVHIDRCVFRDNVATETVSGANYGGGAIYLNKTSAVLYDSLFVGNTSRFGSAVYCFVDGGSTWFDLKVYNCTLTANVGNNVLNVRNVPTDDSFLHVYNSILYDNISSGISNLGGPIETVFSHNCHDQTLEGEGNTTNAPGFFDPDSQNYRLQAGSPCINQGINQAWMDAAVDLDGKPRLDRIARRVDMGCFEFHPRGTVIRIQ